MTKNKISILDIYNSPELQKDLMGSGYEPDEISSDTLVSLWMRENNLTDGVARKTMIAAMETLISAKNAMREASINYNTTRDSIKEIENQSISTNELTALLAEVLDDPDVRNLPQMQKHLFNACISMIRR